MALVVRLVLVAAALLFCIQAFFGGAVESFATPRCVISGSRCSSRVASGRVFVAVPGATETTTQKQPRPQHHLYKRGSSSEENAAWYNHVVKQGVTLALPAIVMLSVVTATPIMVINPQPVQAAAATKEDLTMLKNDIKEMFDNKFDAQSNKIDALDNKYILVPIVSISITAFINKEAISDVTKEVKKDTKEAAKEVAEELVVTWAATLPSAKDIRK